MLIDCETCAARGPACSDCVIAFLTGPDDRNEEFHDLTSAESQAVAVLARSGLVPPLRLTPAQGGRGPRTPGDRCA